MAGVGEYEGEKQEGVDRGREWEGGWGGAQEEEREREALMLKVSWRLLGL